MKMIIGAEQTKIEGWISTQEDELNLLSVGDWDKQFLIESMCGNI